MSSSDASILSMLGDPGGGQKLGSFHSNPELLPTQENTQPLYLNALLWSKMDSAPKDGSVFVGGWYFNKKWVYRLGRWDGKHFNEFPSGHRAPFTHWHPPLTPPTL